MNSLTVHEAKLLIKAAKRHEIIRWLIEKKKFSPSGAEKCADAFFETMEYAGLMNKYGKLSTPEEIGQ